MDRLDSMAAFVAILDEGSLAAAGRRLRRSPAAMTRALAGLERRLRLQLLHRTTRGLQPTAEGQAFAQVCRKVLADLAEADLIAPHPRGGLSGELTITAPATLGRLHVRPVADAFLDREPGMAVRLLLLDRLVNLVEEGIDLAVRVGARLDASLVAVKLGTVRKISCASPAYLAARGCPSSPSELATHACVAFSAMATSEAWSFAEPVGGPRLKPVKVAPRLTVNSAEAALASAVEGHGIVRLLSYQAREELEQGRLVRILEAYEPPPLAVQLVYREQRRMLPKLRAFVDFAVPLLKQDL